MIKYNNLNSISRIYYIDENITDPPAPCLVELVEVLHVAEEDVPDDGDCVDVGDAVLGRHVDKVDVLRRRPDAPVKLRMC